MRAFMLAPIALVACGDDLPAGPNPNVLELEMHASIPANSEVEYCKFVEIPTTYITHDTIEFTGGSHHVLVFQTPYASIPTHKDDGTPIDTSDVFDCTSGATNGWTVQKVIGGSQNRDGEALLSFPPGIGVHVGGVALINVHYINGFDQPLDTDVKIVFDTLPSSQITQEGDVLFLYNPLISVGPGQTSRAEWRCPVYRDLHIANVQSHMHSRGVGYEARIDNQAPFYVNDRWEGVPVVHYDDLVVKAGSTFDYHCDYRNTSGRSIYQGPRTTDEMCMLIGSYYPRDARTANCLDATGNLPGGDWVGQGAATCAATMGCMQGAKGDFHALTDCVLASKAEVSHQISDLLRCTFAATNPLEQCGAQIQACGAI